MESNELVAHSPRFILNIQTVEEAKEGYEKLKALISYFSRDYNQAYEIAVQMLEYACKGGELIEEMQANGELGQQKGGRPKVSQASTLKLSDLDITRNQSSRWQKMASVSKEKREEYYGKMLEKEELPTNAGLLKIAKTSKQKQRKKDQIQAIENIPDNRKDRYHIIVIDPPWAYKNRANDVTHRAANPYPSMTIKELELLELPHENDCILWLWTTNAFMVEAHHLAVHWGFEVKTILTWAKNRMGLGDWLRGQTEHCLMCIKGKPIVNLTNQTTIINGPLREHSRKPDSFYNLVEELCIGHKIEFFAREQRKGWDVYGNETNKF
jgi:N6-adenosine-specific RNA methylase IME4